MPVLRANRREGGAAGDVDDPPAPAAVEEMRDGEAAEVGRGLQVDGQRPLPGRVPFLVGRIVGDALIDAGIVDENVDLAAELVERGVPDVARRRRVHEIAGDQLVAALGRMADDAVPVFLEERVSGRADAAAGPGDEDVHGPQQLNPLRGQRGGSASS